MVGRDLEWVIDDDSHVTSVSACMVNGENVGILQHTGNKNWWKDSMPKNVTIYSTLQKNTNCKSKCRHGKDACSSDVLLEILFLCFFAL